MEYPRVIIIGETFRMNGGGGITMSNLFSNWPPENIGVITDRISETDPLTAYTYYQLGSEEIKFPLPFSLIQAKFKSGPYNFEPNKSTSVLIMNSGVASLSFKKKLRPVFDKFLKALGLNAFFYKIGISRILKDWIIGFKPDIIYIQPFHHNIIRFGNLLYRELKIPYTVHVMDDSVKYINKSRIFEKFFQKFIEKDFEKLIANAKVRMCISEAMAEEYSGRYKKSFLHFRNPVDTTRWLPFRKSSVEMSDNRLKIIYTGRLFSPTLTSLIDLCRVVDRLNRENQEVVLDIFTHDKNPEFFDMLDNLTGTVIHKPVLPEEMPVLIQKYDIFFLCLDFDSNARKYARYSISTRTSEGMISGVPILMYAPPDSAQYRYFEKTGSGCIVGERNIDLLEASLLKLRDDKKLRENVSEKAVKTALADSDAAVVRENFRKAITI